MPPRVTTEADLLAQRAMMTPPDDKLDYMLIEALGHSCEHYSRDQCMRFGFIISHLALMVGAAGAGREDVFKTLMDLGALPGKAALSDDEVKFALYYLEVCTMIQKGIPGFVDTGMVRRLLPPMTKAASLREIFNTRG